MNGPENYFRKWFGIPDTNPDHYLLLGIGPSESDPLKIREAAEARLAILKSIREPSVDEIRKTLADRIKTAYATLSSPDKRAAYDGSLVVAHPLTASLATEKTGPKLAIPLATPLNHVTAPMASASPPSPVNVSISRSESAIGDAAGPDSEFQIRSKSRRYTGRRSLLWPLLALLFFVIGPALIIILIALNSNQFRLAGLGSDDKTTTQTSDVPSNLDSKKPDSKPSTRPDKQKENSDKPSVLKPPTPDSSENIVESDPSQSDETSANDSENDNSENAPPSNMADNDPMPLDDSLSSNGEAADTGEPEFPESYSDPRIATAAELVFHDIRYRRIDSARKRLELLAKLNEKPDLQMQIDALNQAVQLGDAFWNQLIKSCSALKGGAELKLAEEDAALVDATDQFMEFKIKGVVCRAYFENLPIDLAIQLAEKGSIADIPTWRLSQAVAWISDLQNVAQQESNVQTLLNQSEGDGHSVAALRWLLARQIATSESIPTRSTYPPEAARKEAEKRVAALVPVKPIEQSNVVARYREIEQLLNAATQESDPLTKLAALERALKGAERLCDIHLAREILNGIQEGFEIDLKKRLLNSANEMTRFANSADQAERLCDSIIMIAGYGWPKFTAGMADPKELSEAHRLANKLRLKAAQDRIAYLTKQD